MPDSTTINYLDLMRNGTIPVKIKEFQHYVTPGDTSKYQPITIDFDLTQIHRNGNKKHPEENSENVQASAYNYRDYPTRLMDRVRLSGALGAAPTAYLNYRSTGSTRPQLVK